MKARLQRRVLRVADAASLQRCLPLLCALRPHLKAATCRRQIQRQRQQGYELIALEEEGQILAVAGYRVLENLACGGFLYVDDLVTCPEARDLGHGRRLLQWLLREAGRLTCSSVHLDSGVQRHAAHGFYLRNRLHITAHHFSRSLS